MFGALEFSEKLAGSGIQPIVGCALAVDFGDEARDPRLAGRARRAAAHRAARRARGRLPQPDAARPRAPSSKRRSSEQPHLKLAWLEGATDGLIALTGGPGGPLDRRDRGRAGRACRRRAATALRRLFGDRLYVELQRHGTPGRAQCRAGAARSRLRQGHSARRHQRAVLRQARGLRGARRADLHRRRPRGRRDRAAAAHAPSITSRPAPRWRRCSPTCPRRSPRRSRSRERCAFRPRHPQADPAALHGRRPTRSTRRRSCASAAEEGLDAAHRHARPRARAAPIEDYRERLDFELGVIERMKYPGYFLIVVRLHPVGEGAGHSGRAGPRLGRGLARRLCAHHHRPRSDPLRPAVRALPQSRARVDAGLRHRLLPGPARRGDPLRAGALRPRPGRRRSSPSARCRRAACCATSAACWKCPTGRSTSCASSCRRTRPRR